MWKWFKMNLRANPSRGKRSSSKQRLEKSLAACLAAVPRTLEFGCAPGRSCASAAFSPPRWLRSPARALVAAELCPSQGGTQGKVKNSVNERLELTLVGGLQLKIAGVDPPRPTPGDPDLDVRARDRLAKWLIGQEIVFQPLEQGSIAGDV
jgi:hypothetical protein